MQGIGYLVSENGRVYSDNVFNYDSWEYFEGKLEGYERILKTISSLMKNEIGIDLLLNAYEVIKLENKKENLCWYTKEGLDLAGFSKDNIENIKNRNDFDEKYRKKIIDIINRKFLKGINSWNEYIENLFDKYGFDEQVIIALFSYAHDKRALHRNYIQATAEAWSMNNIKTFDDLIDYYEKQDKHNKINNEIIKRLNLHRKLTTYEEEYVIKWIENYKFSIDIIDFALKYLSSKNKVSFVYIDALLTDWYKKDLHTVDEVNTYLIHLEGKTNRKKRHF